MERQEASGVATKRLGVTSRFLLKETGFGAGCRRCGPGFCDTTSQGDR